MQSVGASFKVTAGTCEQRVSGAIQGIAASLSRNAVLHYLCDVHGNLHYLADVNASGETIVQKPVDVGDQIRVSMTTSGSTLTATVRNVTKGWTVTRSGSAGSLSPVQIGTFKEIGIGYPPVTQFEPVTFTNVKIGGQPLGQWTGIRVILTDFDGTVQARPSAITNDKSFTSTWKHT
jgi:hypothetical protein